MNTIKVDPIKNMDVVRPLWSVVIPSYNSSNYLRSTIQSVLIQDRGPSIMEIWVVDDCSDESPEDLVYELGKGRINFFRQSKNVGQLNNFDTCLNLATGKIIHLLHGDDFVQPGFYQALEEPILSDERIGAGFTGYNIVDENNSIIESSSPVITQPGVITDFISIIASKQVIQTPSIVVKREVYEKIGAFNKDLSWVEDWEMWIRIACNYDFYCNPEILASYRIHNSSNTADSLKTGRYIEDVLKCIKVYCEYLKVPQKKKTQIINNAKQHYLDYAIQQCVKKNSLTMLPKCLKLIYSFPSFFQLFKATVKMVLTNISPG